LAPARPPTDAYARSRNRREAEATAYLEGIAEQLRARGLTVKTEVHVGAPALVLLGELRADDVAVMTTHGRGGVRRWLLGSVAEKLVREAAAPILLVRAKPEERAT
jgi:nucleotide-binding universal stress UspA family protein